MFKRRQHFDDYYLQQYRQSPINMGNPYFGVSPYSNYQPQTILPNYQYHPAIQNYQNNGGGNFQHSPYHYTNVYPIFGGKSSAPSLFQNPLEPEEPYIHQMQLNSNPMIFNPYPKTNMISKPNGGIGTIMNSFKGQDGSFDLNKMMNTAGQMMNAVSQVSAMVKGLGGMFKV